MNIPLDVIQSNRRAIHVAEISRLGVLGGYGKAIEGAVSVNLAPSAGFNCDRGCGVWDKRYAARLEKRWDRRELLAKLERHASAGATKVFNQASAEVSKRDGIPWLRISTDGSVPNKPTRSERKALRHLLAIAKAKAIPTHFPVETPRKASLYRRIVGILAVVRESVYTRERWLTAKHACSMVAGSEDMTRPERVAESKRVAARRTAATGRKCIVCPAVAARYLNGNKPSDKAKCGNCVACAMRDVDVVYPLH